MADLMESSRAYAMNVTAANAAKEMAVDSIEIAR
jgi:flagellar basal body rod protein FlgC